MINGYVVYYTNDEFYYAVRLQDFTTYEDI